MAERRVKVTAEQAATSLGQDERPAINAVTASNPMRLSVTWGDEHIQPVQYNGFHVGSVALEVTVVPGQDPVVVYGEVWKLLEQLGREQFRRKLEAYVGRLKESGDYVRTNAAKA